MRKEVTRDESANIKPVLEIWEGKQSLANADLRRKLASETLHLSRGHLDQNMKNSKTLGLG